MGDDEIFPNEWVDRIVEEISHEEVVNELLRRDMTTNGLSMMELVMKNVTIFFRKGGYDIHYEKLMSEPKSIADIEAFAEVADLWRWKSVDQACFSNDQIPGQVYRILFEGVTMYLFVEIDTDDPNTQPQTTAMKLWQDVTFGRVNNEREGVSVATIRVNMGTAKKDQFPAYYASDDVNRNLMYPGQIYTWVLDLARASVYTVGNFIVHNFSEDEKKKRKHQSAWTKVIGSSDAKNVYDLHFLIGDYEGKFPSRCFTGRPIPPTKTIDEVEARLNKVLGSINVQPGGQPSRNYMEHTPDDEEIQKQSYRPICRHNNKLQLPVGPAGRPNPVDRDKCLQFEMYTDVHVGKTENYGATLNYFFVRRVNWGDIEAAVLKVGQIYRGYDTRIQNAANPAAQAALIFDRREEIITVFKRKVRGAWYLQDMQHFLTFAKEEWQGLLFEDIIDVLFDSDNVIQTLLQNLIGIDYIPDTWHKIQEDDSATNIPPQAPPGPYTRKELNFWVYDQILEPFVAEMENIYHRIIYNEVGQELRFPTDEQTHWLDMNARLLQLKEEYESNQLMVRTRENNGITQELPAKFKKMNLRDCLLLAIKEKSKVKLEPDLERYLAKYKSEYMAVFCRLVQCHSLIALHELANKYQVEHYKEMIETALDSFGLTVQSEILFMLNEVAKESSIVFKTKPNSQIKVAVVKRARKPFWIRRFRGGYTFGTADDPTHLTDVAIPLTNPPGYIPELDDHLRTLESERIIYWKCLTQQDFYKGLPRNDGAGIVGDPNEYKLMDIYRQFKVRNPGILQVDDYVRDRMREIYSVGGEGFVQTVSNTYFTNIKRLFSMTLKVEDGTAMPLLFYTRIYFACRHIVFASLIARDGLARYPYRLWQEPRERHRDGLPSDEFMRVTLRENNRRNDVEMTKNVAKALMYTECICLLFHVLNPDNNQLDRDFGGLLHFINTEIEEIKLNTNIVEIATITRPDDARVGEAMTLPDGINTSRTMRKLLYYPRLADADLRRFLVARDRPLDRENHKTTRIYYGSHANAMNNLDNIMNNLNVLVLLMKLHCNAIMAEIEIQIKNPMILHLTRKFSREDEPEGNLDVSIDDIFNDDQNTSRNLKRLIQFPGPSAETLENCEDLFSKRELWFKNKYENYFMSSFFSLRDVGLFRLEPFRARIFQNKLLDPDTKSITVCIAAAETANVTRKLMIHIPNNNDDFFKCFNNSMILNAYLLTIENGNVSNSGKVPLYLNYANPIELGIVDRIRAKIKGTPMDPLDAIPSSFRARVQWDDPENPVDDSLLLDADEPEDGNSRIITCRTWSTMLTVYTRAHPKWSFTPELNNPAGGVDYTRFEVSLYHGNIGENTMERDTSRLWKELYEKCLLPHNPLVPQNVKDVYDDFVKIERSRMKMFRNLETKTLPGTLAAYWLARDDSAPICFKHGQGDFFINCEKCSRNRKFELERAEARPDDRGSILSQKQWEIQFTRAYRWKYLAISSMQSIISKNILWRSLSEYRNNDPQLQDDLNDFDNPGA
tara:strand:- start:1469 stop:6016 length:4548 start_codon:yes stop_codon:yes gene_type:complete